MSDTGQYASVALEGIDRVAIAGGFGMAGIGGDNESELRDAITHGLDIVMNEQIPYLIDVKLPLGLPAGGPPAEVWKFAGQYQHFPAHIRRTSATCSRRVRAQSGETFWPICESIRWVTSTVKCAQSNRNCKGHERYAIPRDLTLIHRLRPLLLDTEDQVFPKKSKSS